MQFKSISELCNSIKNDYHEIALTEGDEHIKEIYQEEAEYMYSEYTPKNKYVSKFREGQSGSFADEVNFISNVSSSKNRIKYKLRNDRMTDCTCSYCSGKNIFLDQLIADGIYGHAKLVERPVMDRVNIRLERGELDKMFASEMKKRGWNIK